MPTSGSVNPNMQLELVDRDNLVGIQILKLHYPSGQSALDAKRVRRDFFVVPNAFSQFLATAN